MDTSLEGWWVRECVTQAVGAKVGKQLLQPWAWAGMVWRGALALEIGARRGSAERLNLSSCASPPSTPPRAVYSSKSDKDKDPPPPKQPIDLESERKRGQELLESNPSKVSSQSSVRHVVEEAQAPASADHDMAGELKHDIDIVKDTFRFKSVPRESHILGLAGTLPYLGTSLSTVFLAWDLNKEWPTGNSFLDAIFIDHETAKYLLSVIEPIQLGYGAVIISFLGAIHWGLEYAEKQPLRERTRFRYGMGLAASIVAWPTLFLPVEYALTTQFMAFVALYFADSRAATRGWAPHWGDTLSAHGLSDNFSRSGIADHDTNWTKLEEEEKERIKKEKKEQEEKEAKEAAKKKKEEKKGKKKSDKGDDKAKATNEGSGKKEEEKSDKKDDEDDTEENEEAEDQDQTKNEDEGDEQESKDEAKDKKADSEKKDDKKAKGDKKGKKDDKESKDENKDEKDDQDSKEEDSESKDSKDDSEADSDDKKGKDSDKQEPKDTDDKPKDSKSKGKGGKKN
ncbi:hypothetical protein NM208_g8493 [Fusarium decemcellulare]|uniref:Uncharacterized protein n=1 Tax=Fusarium decemcellulare TaxID=57161 RepID=A0ACC1S5P8_9HYPO|nr:hypothetical protein NM208_g8493 [Fusarium decemcellulare]